MKINHRLLLSIGTVLICSNFAWGSGPFPEPPQEISEAVSRFNELLQLGDAEAHALISTIRRLSQADEPFVIRQLRLSADVANQPDAQYDLGLCCFVGQDVPQNYQEAVVWFKRAAEQGHAYAQYYLASCYTTGDGVEKNEAQALLWFKRAAEQGHAYAQYNLGAYYILGQGVEQNLLEGLHWQNEALKKASDLNSGPVNTLNHICELAKNLMLEEWHSEFAQLKDAINSLLPQPIAEEVLPEALAAQDYWKHQRVAYAQVCLNRNQDAYLKRFLVELNPHRKFDLSVIHSILEQLITLTPSTISLVEWSATKWPACLRLLQGGDQVVTIKASQEQMAQAPQWVLDDQNIKIQRSSKRISTHDRLSKKRRQYT